MLGKVKTWLGIEGVKLELVVPADFNPRQGSLSGTVRLTSKHAQTVTGIKLVIVEKYSRGRGEELRTDEYELGRSRIDQHIEVPADGITVDIPFYLRYELAESPVDEFGERNALFGGLAWAARKVRNASSEYRIEAEAQVSGVGLNPFDKKVLG